MLKLVPFRLAYDRLPTRTTTAVRAGKTCFAIQHKDTGKVFPWAYTQESFALLVLSHMANRLMADEISLTDWIGNPQSCNVTTLWPS